MSLEIEIKSNSKQAEASLKRLLSTLDELPTSVRKSGAEISSFSKDVSNDLKAINKNVEKSGKSLQNTVRSLSTFAKITGGLITSLLAAGGISSLSSQFTELNNRIALTTGRTGQLVVQQQKLFGIARRSNVDLETTVNLYSSLVVNAQRGRKEATALTEVLIKAGKIGGGPAATISASLTQLQQGLAAGTLRGDELNSVLEGTPRIAQAIAKELKTTVGQLKKLAEEGKISGDTVANALLNAKDDIEAEFATLKIPFNQIIANSGRELGISLNRLFGTVSDTLKTITGGEDIVQNLTAGITNAIDNISVFLRVIQTDILLLKLEFGSLEGAVVNSFKRMVDGVVSYASRLFGALDAVKSFAKSVGTIFYDLYIEIVGNSTWPDLVNGVVDYTDNLNKAATKVNSFAAKAGGIFASLRDKIKDAFEGIVFPSTEGFQTFLKKIQNGIKLFVNKLTSFAVVGIIGALAAALTAAFAIAVIGGGFAGSLGAKIATAFIGVVGAYLIGIVDSFDMGRATSSGPMNELLESQVNILLTIAHGISALVSGAAPLMPTDSLEKVMNFLSENIIAVAASLPILVAAIKTMVAAGATGGSSILNPLGGATKAVGQNLGDVWQGRAAGGFIRGLQAQGQLLNAELGGLKESIRGQKLRLESELSGLATTSARANKINQELVGLKAQEKAETTKLVNSIQMNQKKLQINSQLLDGPNSRLKETLSAAIGAFGRLGGMIGGTVGGFLGAGMMAKAAKTFGMNSAETMISVLIAAQLGQLIVGSIVQAIFQVTAATFQMLITGLLTPMITSVFVGAGKALLFIGKGFVLLTKTLLVAMRVGILAGAAALRVGIMASFVAVRAIMIGAQIAGATAGAAITLAASSIMTASSLVFLAAVQGAAFLLAMAPISGMALLVIGLVAALVGAIAVIAYLLSDEIMAAGEVLMGYIRAGFDFLEEVGRKLGGAIFEGMTWLKEAGTTFADSILDGLSGLVDLASEMGSTILSYIKSAFGFGGGSDTKTNEKPIAPVKRANGGSVFGAGSATSDSIPAMLSNGEFVMKTSVASEHRPFLEQLNSTGKLPGFAGGGSVGSSSSATSSGGGGVLSGMGDLFMSALESLGSMLESLLGKENYASVSKVISGLKDTILKGFNAFGGDSSKASDSIFSADDLIISLTKTLSDQTLDTDVLAKELAENASLTKRLLDLSDSRNKVQAKIFEMEKRNEKVPLQLLSQLKILDNDLITQLGNVSAILEDVAENTKVVIPAIAALASKGVGKIKGDVESGIGGLLKGETDFKGFANGLLDSFTGTVLDTLASGITESIFNNVDGEASDFSKALETMFSDIGMLGFGGEEGGGILSSLGGIFGFGGGKEDKAPSKGGSAGDYTGGAFAAFAGDKSEGGSAKDYTGGAFAAFTGGGAGAAEGAGEGVEAGMDAGAGSIGKIFDGFLPGLGGLFDGLLGGFGGVFSGLLSSLGGLFGGGGGGGDLLGSLGGLFGGGEGGGGIFSAIGGFFNDGGLVPGGGPTPVIAHGGEMILNKRQQSNLFGELDRSRNGQAGNQQQISINVTGDISRQTKKEIYSMMPTIAQGVNQQNKEQNRK